MRVILRENIENLGKKGDIVNVAPGFGRNYLIPKKIALEVTSRNKKMIEIEQRALQKGFEEEKASYQELIDRLNGVTLSFTRKTSEKDVIFGSVSSTDIRDALVAQGFDVEKKKILLHEPIKRLGNYSVPIKIFHEERAEVKLEVVKEGEPGIPEDTPPSPEPIDEGAAGSEPVVEKEELPVPEEKKEEVPPPAEENAKDESAEVEEEPKPEPAVEEAPKEEEKLEAVVEPDAADVEKDTADESILEETMEEPEDTKLVPPEPEEKTEEGDNKEAESKDKK
jgi:large subunit ribosomal protein L9